MLNRDCFERSSQDRENGFVESADRFAASARAKSVHRSAIRERTVSAEPGQQDGRIEASAPIGSRLPFRTESGSLGVRAKG
jgi:hypothetical protein